ncbi:hypothetical protein GCM10007385_32960 [Tateyamaria omphalii]|uniref:hypothetical protein n=1 Tax=Tateyamaria omphalii TaxID=299262 RepID=UPI0016738C65|nr:hypothetical protein [Tateyamaria omphalii]GGX61096.1 hypothetical protein GCM10007385_32960 [Tateyamaria omphalii]
MYRPGSTTGLDAEASAEIAQFVEQAIEVFQAGWLQPTPEDWANGRVDVFPQLTEDERRLRKLPDFTPERVEQWLETYPVEELGLPADTGSPIPDDPTDNIISIPIPEETGPNIVEARPGNTTTPDGNSILPHGSKGNGQEYISLKGHDVEQIDNTIANPCSDLSGIVEGRGRYNGQEMTLLTDQDGY